MIRCSPRFSLPLLLAILAPTSLALAAQPEKSPVQAATDAAISGLAVQIDRLPLGPKLTVGQYLDSVHGRDFMLATLQRAQLIGGPRSLGDKTVQVRLDITGRVVADALSQIAAVHTKRSNYSPDFIAMQSRAWSDRTFTSTATSTGQLLGAGVIDPKAVQVNQLQPVAPATNVGGPEIPATAIDAAKRSAAQLVLTRVGQVQLAAGRTAAEFLSLTGVSDAVSAEVISRPVRSVTSRNEGEVHVFLTLDRSAVFDTFKLASIRSGAPIVPDEAGWSAYREPIIAAVPEEIEGVATPAKSMPAIAAPAALTFSTDRPPEWFSQSLDCSGSAPWAGSKLLTARAAETDALALLRKQLEALELSKGLTLSQAATKDSHFGDALTRAVDRARVFRVEYFEDGSAGVKISTDARYLWQDIVATQGNP